MMRLKTICALSSALLLAIYIAQSFSPQTALADPPASPAARAEGDALLGPLPSGYLPREVGPVIDLTDADRKGHDLMLRVIKAMRERETVYNQYYGTNGIAMAEAQRAAAQTDQQRLGGAIKLMFANLDFGNEAIALNLAEEVQQIAASIGDERLGQETLAELNFFLGLVHLRYGETQNCCLMRNIDSCLLPIRGGGVHTKQEWSRQAVSYFRKSADLAKPGSDRYLDAIWLLNLATMTLGEFPMAVPEEHRLKPELFESKEEFPRLYNIAKDMGLDTVSMCGSVVADDFNNDGYLDMLVSTWDVRRPLQLYMNDGAGHFVDKAKEAGLDAIPGGLNMIQGDYNNDGRIDVYIFRGAWLFEGGKMAASLLRNNGDGTFTDVTFPAGLGEESYPGQAGGWSDYDLDGWLDLFVAGEAGPQNRAPCRLFHNNQDGTFTEVSVAAGVSTNQTTKGMTGGDYNNDRYPDIYLSNLGGRFVPGNAVQKGSFNRLFRNNKDGTFTDVAEEAGVLAEGPTFGTWFWDYNNDGILDLYVANYDASTRDVALFYKGEAPPPLMPRVFRGTLDGKFVEATAELGITEPTLPMGSNFGDLDNDGWLDMYLGTGSPDYQMIIPNKLYHNIGGQKFIDISESAGMAHLQKGHGCAFVDLDADGDQDVFMQMGGALPVDSYADALYENPGFGNNWLSVELVGVDSNRFGVGSRIRLDVEDNGQARSIYKWVNSGGSFGCNSLRQQIGIGKATVVKRLEVYWPKSDTTQVFENLPANGIVRVTEGSDDLVKTGLRATEFDRPRTVAAAN
jgi:hypothetical protein